MCTLRNNDDSGYGGVVNLTISLSEETVRRLRRTVRDRYGSRRGAISGLMEEALVDALDRLETPSEAERFRAVRGSEVLAEARDLDELADKLRRMKIDARSVRILSSRYLSPVARAGFRARKT